MAAGPTASARRTNPSASAAGTGTGSSVRCPQPRCGRTWLSGPAGQLDDGERVAAGGVMDPGGAVGGTRGGVGGPQQVGGARRVQAGDGQLRQVGTAQRARLAVAERGHDEDRVGDQPAGREHQRLRGGPVEMVRVVEEDRQGLALRAPRHHPEGGGPDREPVRRRPGVQGEGGPQRRRLGWRQLVQLRRRRAHRQRERPERQVALGLGAGDPHDVHLLGPVGDVVQQRRLADPRLTDQEEHAAAAKPGPRDQPVEDPPFGIPPHEHVPSLGTRDTPWGRRHRTTREAPGCGARPAGPTVGIPTPRRPLRRRRTRRTAP